MKAFVEYVATALVDHPEDVRVEEDRWRDRVIYRLHVHETDMGKVIGKGGRIAHAMRTMLKAGATLDGSRVSLDIG